MTTKESPIITASVIMRKENQDMAVSFGAVH